MSVIERAERVLRSAQFASWRMADEAQPALGFESVGLMGFVLEFESPHALIEDWKPAEDRLLRKFAPVFSRAGDKAWNVYVVLVTQPAADEDEARRFLSIEEDLTQTRKLTGHGILDDDGLRNSLLPLLPIIERPLFADFDPKERLATRLDTIVDGVSSVMLDESVDAAQVLQFLRH